MLDILSELNDWRKQGIEIALATVTQTWGSSPRGTGARMGVTSGLEMAGSVSGGCVEGAVAEVGREVLRTNRPRLLHFGISNEQAWEVGLACGGKVDVFVQKLDPDWLDAVQRLVDEQQAFACPVVIQGPENLLGRQALVVQQGRGAFSLAGEGRNGGDEALFRETGLLAPVMQAAEQALNARQSLQVKLEQAAQGEDVTLFVDVVLPPPVIVMIGGVHIAIALSKLAQVLGYRTVVVDPRRAFGHEGRFPHAGRLIQAWPDEALAELKLNPGMAVVTLSHDPKIDDPALIAALPSPAFYVGALGSRKTHAARRERLLKAGLSEALIDRIHSPIGLDLGGRTPEEIALAILAQIVQAWNGKAQK